MPPKYNPRDKYRVCKESPLSSKPVASVSAFASVSKGNPCLDAPIWHWLHPDVTERRGSNGEYILVIPLQAKLEYLHHRAKFWRELIDDLGSRNPQIGEIYGRNVRVSLQDDEAAIRETEEKLKHGKTIEEERLGWKEIRDGLGLVAKERAQQGGKALHRPRFVYPIVRRSYRFRDGTICTDYGSSEVRKAQAWLDYYDEAVQSALHGLSYPTDSETRLFWLGYLAQNEESKAQWVQKDGGRPDERAARQQCPKRQETGNGIKDL
ncbi:hypothetical protein B0J12DRAFT_699347 [Macrophomina phaseolina]|uniref:Uncharacterized protein n=1 Tax=Macrophomina phaseolina TaxID=35725 RepID=A0ABQ8GEN4_9PEZI|nr:hypothetical protein B0J12DRAFT_699347 [Macrophomina phaseolina]